MPSPDALLEQIDQLLSLNLDSELDQRALKLFSQLDADQWRQLVETLANAANTGTQYIVLQLVEETLPEVNQTLPEVNQVSIYR